jgi:hypothetical protein
MPGDQFEEPDSGLSDPAVLLVEYLRAYRATLLRKVDGLGDDQLRRTILPSGWTPLELINHLAHVERRWIRWGFHAEEVDRPWGDEDPETGRWQVGGDQSLDTVRRFLEEQAAETDRTLGGRPLEQTAASGGRFDDNPPTLIWIGFHLLQEYARHVGHLDIVRELIDDSIGE